MAELNTTKINGNISATGTVSGTNITTMQNEINELNDNLEERALSGSANGITSYPTKAGIYRVTGSDIGFPFSTYNYGILIITFSGYVQHIFIDSTSKKIWCAIDADSIKCPSTWWELTAIKYADITETTSTTGAMSIGNISSINVVNAIVLSHSDYYAQIYTGWSASKYGVVIKNYTSDAILANTEVTVRYWYY